MRPQLDLARRTSSFDEVQGGLTEDNALFEARRCLCCGNCFECDNCYGVCPDNAVIKLGPGQPLRVQLRLLQGLRHVRRRVPLRRHRDGARGGVGSRLDANGSGPGLRRERLCRHEPGAAAAAGRARVRAAARNLKVLEARDWQGVELVQADALDPATLPAALHGVDVAYYLVHSMAAGRDFGRLDVAAARAFAAAAAAAGVSRIVYLGGLVPPEADSEHLVSRRETGEVLRAGTVPVTELRAGIIVGPGSAAYEVIRDLVNHLPLMVTPRWVKSKSSPIALENLLEYLVRLPQIDEAAGRIYEAAGPEVLSYESMMREFGAAVGKRPRIIPVPVLSPGLSALLAVADHDGAGQHRAGVDRWAQARHPGRRRGLAPHRAAAAAGLSGVGAGGAEGRARTRRGGALDRGQADVPRQPARLLLLRQARGRLGHLVGEARVLVAGRHRHRWRQPLLHAELALVAARGDRLDRRRAGLHARAARPAGAAAGRHDRLLDRDRHRTGAPPDAELRS